MIVAIIQARMNSTRLPGKVLLSAGESNLLALQLKRLSASKKIDTVLIATTTDPADDKIEMLAREFGVYCYRGSENDVLDRFYQASRKFSVIDYVVRLTADCPLTDVKLVDNMIGEAVSHQYDYYSNTLQPSFPDGMDVEIIKYSALVTAWKQAILVSEREHVTPYIWKNSSYHGGTLFTSGNYFSGNAAYKQARLTVDEADDYKVILQLIDILGENAGWQEYADYYLQHPEVCFNRSVQRNEGYTKSLMKDNKSIK